MTKYDYVLKSIIVSFMVIILLALGILSGVLGFWFWYYFNLCFVSLVIYFLCIYYIEKEGDKQ